MSRQQLIHIHSSVYDNGPKSPSATSLNYGELAVNYNATEPALFIRNANDVIVKFNPITRAEIDEILETIDENERVTAAAINELNNKKLNSPSDQGSNGQVLISDGTGGTAWSTLTHTWGNIGGELSAQTDLQSALDSKQASINDIDAIRNNATSGKTALETINGYGDVVTHNASEFELIANKVTALTSGCTDSQYPSAKIVYNTFIENELVTSSALNTLQNDKISNPSGGSDGDVLVKSSNSAQWKTMTPTWGTITGTLSAQTDLQSALDAKQPTISDLSTIRENAESGVSAYTTISSYGDVVTHNTSEFATSAQGTLADTAIQPNDNISELTNDAGYLLPQDITAKTDISNQITAFTSACTDTQYPSAKLVYDTIMDNEEVVSQALNDLDENKINEPTSEGANGNVLMTDGNGGRSWTNILSMSITSNGTTLTLQQWIDRISSITIDE